jgi:Na+-transporting methylmalonyl-CoA/oxaloacetate decarboxylase, beta subunit
MDELLVGIVNLSWKHVAMWVVAGILIYLAIRHDYEPLLLLPIGFGAILTNIPFLQRSATKAFSPVFSSSASTVNCSLCSSSLPSARCAISRR